MQDRAAPVPPSSHEPTNPFDTFPRKGNQGLPESYRQHPLPLPVSETDGRRRDAGRSASLISPWGEAIPLSRLLRGCRSPPKPSGLVPFECPRSPRRRLASVTRSATSGCQIGGRSWSPGIQKARTIGSRPLNPLARPQHRGTGFGIRGRTHGGSQSRVRGFKRRDRCL